MRILLIEDDEVIAERIKTGLEKAHFSVDLALDGETGLEMAREGPYTLFILDLMLPARDGWSVCEALRLRRNSIPILMLTARGSVQDRVRGLNFGADDYLPKPFDFTELLARVRALLRRDQLHKSPRDPDRGPGDRHRIPPGPARRTRDSLSPHENSRCWRRWPGMQAARSRPSYPGAGSGATMRASPIRSASMSRPCAERSMPTIR